MYKYSDLEGIKIVIDWESSIDTNDRLQILSYDAVPGSHRPSVVGHFVKLLMKIYQLHQDSIVHGDLRFSNVIFSDMDGNAPVTTIIDFDYSGVNGEKIYPPHFNVSIDDGYRHPGANPMEYLRPEHDITAAKWMCSQYRPKNEKLRNMWSSCMEEFVVDLQAMIDQMKVCEQEPLEPVSVHNYADVVADCETKGTGSPDTNRGRYVRHS
jgi:thiamine kinase-like enzyme